MFNPPKKVDLTLNATKQGKVVSSGASLEGDETSKKILTELLETMIYGSPISQISVYNSLSDYAKKALASLQQSTLDEGVKSKQAKVQALIEEIKRLEQDRDKLSPLVANLKDNKDSIGKQIEELTSRKAKLEEQYRLLQEEKKLVETSLSDLRENGEKDVETEIAKIRQEKETEITRLQAKIDDLRQKGFAKVDEEIGQKKEHELEEMRKSLDTLKHQGIDRVNSEVDEYEKSRKEQIALLESRVDELTSLTNTIESQYNELIDKINGLVKRDNRGQNDNISETMVHDTSIMRREFHLQTVALEAVARRQIAEQQLDKMMKLLIPLLPKDIDIEQYLKENVFEESSTKKM